MKKIYYILASASLVLFLGSCSQNLVRVQPYERGNLASPVMSDDATPLQKPMSEHVYFSREGSFGGGGVGGGGCGCN